MKCPSCRTELLKKNLGGLEVDICYGGCGGIWFDRAELQRVDAKGAATLHTVWHDYNKVVEHVQPRKCPRCADQILRKRWFSAKQSVEIDECAICGGIWLDEGEFSRIYGEIKGQRVAPPGWADAIADVVSHFRPPGEPGARA